MTIMKKHINLFSSHGRLQQARLNAGFKTATAAARFFGWRSSIIRDHESGRIRIDEKWAEKYAAAFGIDVNDLCTDGIFKNIKPIAEKLAALSKAAKGRTPNKRKRILEMRLDFKSEDDKVELLVHQWVPFEVAANIINTLRKEQ